jgi:hypothetical protein
MLHVSETVKGPVKPWIIHNIPTIKLNESTIKRPVTKIGI